MEASTLPYKEFSRPQYAVAQPRGQQITLKLGIFYLNG